VERVREEGDGRGADVVMVAAPSLKALKILLTSKKELKVAIIP